MLAAGLDRRQHGNRVADCERSRLDHAHEAATLALDRLPEPGLELVHALARRAQAADLEGRAADAHAAAEDERREREATHGDLLADGAGRESEAVERLLLGEPHGAPAPRAAATAV